MERVVSDSLSNGIHGLGLGCCLRIMVLDAGLSDNSIGGHADSLDQFCAMCCACRPCTDYRLGLDGSANSMALGLDLTHCGSDLLDRSARTKLFWKSPEPFRSCP